MFKPKSIYYEPDIKNYELGKELLKKYKEVPKFEIANHNNIEEMRNKANKEFANMKKNLIIGIRKTHKFVENHKTSDYLVPYTSSGCIASCLYCYLVCNYNKCAYLRLFVNREQMLDKIIRTAEKTEYNLNFEIGSNSDLVLENSITNNLVWTIENFKDTSKGSLTFPTKFDMIDDILDLNHKGKIIIRIGILIAPVIFIQNWKELYLELIQRLAKELSEKVKKDVFFEIIFMTYSYVHTKINEEAFPNAINLYNKELMKGRGRGKYMYKDYLREEGRKFFIEKLNKYFPGNTIEYIV